MTVLWLCACGKGTLWNIPTITNNPRPPNEKSHRRPSPSPSNPTFTSSNKFTKMADAAGARGGFGSRGGAGDRGRGGRGRGRGRGRRGAGKNEEKEWQPVTKLGRLVKSGKIKSMEDIYLHSLPIKEYQIVDYFLPGLKDEVMKVRNERNFSIFEPKARGNCDCGKTCNCDNSAIHSLLQFRYLNALPIFA